MTINYSSDLVKRLYGIIWDMVSDLAGIPFTDCYNVVTSRRRLYFSLILSVSATAVTADYLTHSTPLQAFYKVLIYGWCVCLTTYYNTLYGVLVALMGIHIHQHQSINQTAYSDTHFALILL